MLAADCDLFLLVLISLRVVGFNRLVDRVPVPHGILLMLHVLFEGNEVLNDYVRQLQLNRQLVYCYVHVVSFTVEIFIELFL